MACYITGDLHGNPTRLSTGIFREQKEFSGNKDENTVICAGDFGLIWNRNGEDNEEKYWLKWLEDKPFTIVFVDGNHECFDRLNKYPVKEWNGGKVHEIRPNVLHLMRGEIYTIEGRKFFAFGGASSHDISDGIIDIEDENWREQAKALDKKGKYMYRIKGASWWPEELPSEEEMQNGIDNLNKHDNKVDYIITHSPYTSLLRQIDGGSGLYKSDILTDYLQKIKQTTDYKHWLFGHMHINQTFYWERSSCLYEQIIRIV